MRRTVTFNRMPRIQEPLPRGEVKLPAPPVASPPLKFGWLQALLPMAGFMLVGSIVYGGLRGDWRLAIPMVAMSCVSAATSAVGRLIQRRAYDRRVKENEAAYTRALDLKRAELESLREEQQAIRTRVDPDLATLLTRARECSPRLWERRPEDADFLRVRLGIGNLPSTVALSVPHSEVPDPRLGEALALEAEYAVVPGVPVTADIRSGPLGLTGPLANREDLARAMICNLVVHHAPDEVHLLAILGAGQAAGWHWLQWLPHTYALSEAAQRHYLAHDRASAEQVLRDLLEELHGRQNQLYASQHGERRPSWPWLVLLVEDPALVRDDPAIHLLLSPEARTLNVTAIFLVDQAPQVPTGCRGVVEIQPGGDVRYAVAGPSGETYQCWPDYADAALCDQLARSLAPTRVYTLQPDSSLPARVRLLDMMDVEDIDEYDVAASWRHRPRGQSLKVPIGQNRGGRPLSLDLNHTGHGPHGLIAGTTGSGKSELLQSLVIGLALTHHPYDVGFVLVDFKGGGAFSGLVELPHTQGLVTDLSGNLTERALVAMRAEMDRRKRLLHVAGVNDIDLYQDLYWRGKVGQPLPRLVVIIDEFAELVSDTPDFMDGLIGIARVGRSLGVHLILATQSPAGVVKQQIWANARFRICLRVETRQESMDMLHRPEAASLPRVPGRGYLQVGNNDVFELFQVARVAGRCEAGRHGGAAPESQTEQFVIAEISPLGRRTVLFDSRQAQRDDAGRAAGRTDLDAVVRRLGGAAEEMGIARLPSPWPDPLPDRVALSALLQQAGFSGWDGSGWAFDRTARTQGAAVPRPPSPALPARPWLGALVGLLDDPGSQRQGPLVLQLANQDGQLIVVGAPGSGKEMWLRTLVMSLARTHSPEEIHFYLLEFSGQALKVLEGLPHVGGVFTPLDGERVRRLLLRLLDNLDERKDLCNRKGVDGLVRLRELQPAMAPPAILVIISGLAEFRATFQDEMLQLLRLVREGGPYGIHTVLVGDRPGDLPTAVSSVVARRVALRLADDDEYGLLLGTRVRPGKGRTIPPGRGWYGRPPLEFQTASPGDGGDENTRIAELKKTADQMNRCWQGPRPQPVEVLPHEVSLGQLLSRASDALAPGQEPRTAVPIGLDGARLQPAFVDLAGDGPHFVVASTPQGGKTTLLLAWALALAELNSPQQVQFVLVSGRRNSLAPLKGLPHVLGFYSSPEAFCRHGGLKRLNAEMERREGLPGDALAPGDDLPLVVVMVDDCDAFASSVAGKQDVLQGLGELARRARDVALTIIVAGPMPDMGGAAYRDPLLKQLRLGRSGFILRILGTADQNPLDVRLKAAGGDPPPAGRGFVVRNGTAQMLQVATAGDRSTVALWAARVRARWEGMGEPPATWPGAPVSPGTDARSGPAGSADRTRQEPRHKRDGDDGSSSPSRERGDAA